MRPTQLTLIALAVGALALVILPFDRPAEAKRRKGKTSSRVEKQSRKSRGEGRRVHFRGRLEDSRRQPIAGIFPLTFSLHKSAKGSRSVWSESYFVAVDNGEYEVELGSKRPIGSKLSLDRIYVAVSLTGGDEITRERLMKEAIASGPVVDTPRPAPPKRSTRGAGRATTTVDYAERAGEALLAQHAQKADKLGEMSLDDLLARIKRGSRGGKVKLGSRLRYSGEAGGTGGFEKDLLCPKGHVVTGIKTRSGKFIDSLQLICSPLE